MGHLEAKRIAAEQGQTKDGKTEHRISDETIEAVGILAKLELSGEEKEQAKKDMDELLGYIDKLQELDTSGVEPMFHLFQRSNVFREDCAGSGDGRRAALANAPRERDGCFEVPKTIM